MEIDAMKVGKLSQLTEARAALAATGKSSRQLGNESKLKVMNWIYCWGYSSSAHILKLLNKTSGGYAQKLVKQGWLASTKTESGNPAVIYTLTESGLQEAERHTSNLYRYPELDPYRINQKLIRHNLLAQEITIQAIRAGKISCYETERMFLAEGDKPGVKHPDVVWITNTGLRIGVEVELSAKWARDLDEFVLAIAKALQPESPKCSRFAVVSDSPAIIQRYKQAMAPGAKLNLWKKNQRKHWAVEKTVDVPDWLSKRVDFQLLGH